MDRRIVPAIVALALFSGACAESAPSSEPETTEADDSDTPDTAVSEECENNLDIVNAASAPSGTDVEDGAFGAALVISDGGPKSDGASPEDGTVKVVITGTNIPEPEYRATWPAEDPGAGDGKNYLSFTLTNPDEAVGPDQTFGSSDDDVAAIADLALYNGSTELPAGDIAVEITEVTNVWLCGVITTDGEDGVGVRGPFKAERN